MDFLRAVLSQDNGSPSSMRIVIMVGVLLPIVTLCIQCLRLNQWIPIDGNTIMLICALLGGKVVQKIQEETPADCSQKDKTATVTSTTSSTETVSDQKGQENGQKKEG